MEHMNEKRMLIPLKKIEIFVLSTRFGVRRRNVNPGRKHTGTSLLGDTTRLRRLTQPTKGAIRISGRIVCSPLYIVPTHRKAPLLKTASASHPWLSMSSALLRN